MDFNIRKYHASDLTSLYRICLKTGDSGTDATHIYNDPDLLGHIYAAPYVVFEPNLCFVATSSDKPFGYILGTRDSNEFYDRCEKEWFPILRNQYNLLKDENKSKEAAIIKRLHQKFEVDPELDDYPAHLHIDLLPEAQGYGLGRKLIEIFIDKLQELKVKGLHLGVGKKNQNATKFYERVGFDLFKELENALIFTKNLE
jgi:ribosomal protein S18 acetylase RimI-like enzyme